MASYHVDLLVASIHTSTTPHVRVMGACRYLHTLPLANLTDATLRCMLGRNGVLLCMPSHARRPVSQLIGIRCCYVEVIQPRTTFSDEYFQPIVPGLMHSAVTSPQTCIPLLCAGLRKSSDPSLSLGASISLYRDNVSVVDRQRILPVLETGVLKGEIARSTKRLTMLRIESMPRPSCRSHVEQAGGLYKILPHAHLLIVSFVWVSDSSNTVFRVTFQDN